MGGLQGAGRADWLSQRRWRRWDSVEVPTGGLFEISVFKKRSKVKKRAALITSYFAWRNRDENKVVFTTSTFGIDKRLLPLSDSECSSQHAALALGTDTRMTWAIIHSSRKSAPLECEMKTATS